MTLPLQNVNIFLTFSLPNFCSEIGTPLGKFLCGGIQAFDIEDIGLGSSGFLKAGKELVKESKLRSINIRLNGVSIELLIMEF